MNDIKFFKEFVINGEPNSRCTYYEGFSLTDSPLSRELKKISFEYAIQGLIYLVQKKLYSYHYEFIAIKAGVTPIISLVPLSETKVRYKPSKGLQDVWRNLSSKV